MSYVVISDSQLDPDAPLTSSLAYQWRDNTLSMFLGDSNAPRLQLAALPRLVVGDVVVCEDLNEYIVPASGSSNVQSIAFIQKGTVRFKFNQRSVGGATCTVSVERLRRGDTVTVSTITTTSASFVAKTVDIPVQVGDMWTVGLSSSGAGGSAMNDFQLCTSGDLIYPGAYMPVVVW
jgi:hypothetical protein